MLSFVDQYVEKFLNEDSQYAADLVTYFKNFLVPSKRRTASIGEYYEHLNAELKTLKVVQKAGKSYILLTIYIVIPYLMNTKLSKEFDTTTEDFRSIPWTFTNKISYIEHFGINKNGQPRSDFDAEKQKIF